MRHHAFRTARWPWVAVAAVALSCPISARLPPTSPLTNIREVLTFTRAEGYPARTVDVRGVVTHFDAERGMLYLQDEDGALGVQVGTLEASLVAGAEVRVLGDLLPGARPPRLARTRLTVHGQSSPELMPPPTPLRIPQLLDGQAEAAWIEVHGVVRATRNRGSALAMDLESDGTSFRAEIANLDQHRYPPLLGCRVRLHGVSAVGTAEPDGAHVLLPDVGYMRIEEEPAPGPLGSGLPLLTTAADVRRLSESEAQRGFPVRLQGVVTYSDAEMRLLFVQDDTAGIYVEAWRHIHHVKAGERVEVHGISAPGAFAPIVDHPRVRSLGRAAFPAATRVGREQLARGRYDSQWVEVMGVVRTVESRRLGAVLAVDVGGVPVTVEIPPSAGQEDLAKRLVNASVRVRGVCRSLLTLKGQLAGTALNAPGLTAIDVVSPPPPEPFDLPVHESRSLMRFLPGQDWEHRVRVQGVVTYSAPGEVYIRDATGGLRVEVGRHPPPSVGDEVDAIGFAAPGQYGPVLENAETRLRGAASPPAPAVATAEQAQAGQYDGDLVSLEGRLVDHVNGPDEQKLLLRAGPYLFDAVLRDTQALRLRQGSRLRLTGICTVSADERRLPQTFRLLLRGAEDVTVVRAAPWWTSRHTAWAAATATGVAALALIWVVTLRRRVAAQAAIIWARVKRETAMQERQRMARELHDTLEQHLAGVSLSLGAASLMSSNMAQEHLTHALEQVRASIAEVHRAVWSLREDAVDSRGLAVALNDIGQQLVACSASAIEVSTSVSGKPRPFPVSVENDLLRIGQEALTNAVKHGKAAHVRVELHYGADAFSLRVADDGRGFDLSVRVPPGHFGLLGMRERADEIGAQLEVRSALNRGTEILVVVPLLALRSAG